MKTYRFRIYPTDSQVTALNSALELCRDLHNAMLQQRIYAFRSGRRVSYNSQQDELPELKNAFPEYRSIHSQVLQDVARRLDKAYDNFYRRIGERKEGNSIKAGFPRFKSRGRYSSITYTQSGFRILDNGHVWLSRLGEVRMFMHRPVTGDIKTISIKRDSAGDWFITVTAGKYRNGETETQEERNEKPHANSPGFMNPIGIDLGLKALITISDGEQIDPPRFLGKSEKKLKRAQKRLSKKLKGSGKRRKARTRVAKVHRKTERQRDDFSHKISRNLGKNHDLITFEDLDIRGMIRNHHLAKSIADASWGRIVQYTMYKAESAGTVVILVNPRDTSRKCSRCGNVRKDLKLSDRIYHCDACNLTMDRDMNAAINIRNAGLNAVGRGTPEFTPVEIGALPAMVTPVAETGSPSVSWGRMSLSLRHKSIVNLNHAD